MCEVSLHSVERKSARLGATSSAMCSGSEAGSYLRLIDSCITQCKAQGPSRTCNESKEEEEEEEALWSATPAQTPSIRFRGGLVFKAQRLLHHSTLGWRVIMKSRRSSTPARTPSTRFVTCCIVTCCLVTFCLVTCCLVTWCLVTCCLRRIPGLRTLPLFFFFITLKPRVE